MAGAAFVVIFILNFLFLVYSEELNAVNEDIYETKSFVFWPNGTIPFHINPDHFDNEQSMTILRALSLFAFVTCLKFAPVMVPPGEEHVLAFENPGGAKKCELQKHGHPRSGPHIIPLGYDCLESPMMERVIMRALGFPLEHNRGTRDRYIDVQLENVEQSAIELFTKEYKLPAELRLLPYDINSVMHFGDRDYSKNGHRTIIFKDRNTKQSRTGLSPTDIRKIEIVYGPECRRRDRQEKIDLCHTYPGVRRKRDVAEETKSLRVNPDITPPPETITTADGNRNMSEEVAATLKNLGISVEVQTVIDDVYKITGKALKNARVKYCNDTKTGLREGDAESNEKENPDILGIIQVVTDYAQSMVDNAVANKSAFCERSLSVDKYQSYLRYKCAGYVDMRGICKQSYKSTKSGRVIYSTQHRPIILQSTWHVGGVSKSPKDKLWRRSNDNGGSREKRQIKDLNGTTQTTEASKDVTSVLRMDTTLLVDNKDDESSRRRGESAKADQDAAILEREETPNFSETDGPQVARAQDDSEDEYSKKRPESGEEQETTERWRPKSEEKYKTSDSPKQNYDEAPADLETPRPIKKRNRVKPKAFKVRKNLPTTVMLSKANEEFYSQRRWPRGVVRYMIDKNGNFDISDVRSRLDEVNQLLRKNTCVRLEEIWAREANKFEDYLVLDHSPDFVTGRVGGKQFFGASELLKGGQHRQHAAMMVMAMLGFYFELSRHDRDKYVRVHLRHIRADKLHHFEKIRDDATLPLAYDYKSATHPSWQFWRKVGKTGISTVATYKDKDPDGSIMKSFGQHAELLSEGDYIKINSVYGIQCMTGEGEHYDDRRHNKRKSKHHKKKSESTSSDSD